MQTITINNQQLITLPNAAKELNISKQSLHRIIKDWSISLISISGNLLALSLPDFQNIRDNRDLAKRPNRYKK